MTSLLLLFSTSLNASTCSAGGPGSSSCSISGEIVGTGITVSVSCQDGYYACCKLLVAGDPYAECIKNDSGGGPGDVPRPGTEEPE